jgi:hypothetical protein
MALGQGGSWGFGANDQKHQKGVREVREGSHLSWTNKSGAPVAIQARAPARPATCVLEAAGSFEMAG